MHSKSEREERPRTDQRVLLVDGSSVAVQTFYALGGGKYLTDEVVEAEVIDAFVADVINTTLKRITDRVTLDKHTSVRIALESPIWAPIVRYTMYEDYKHAATQPSKPAVARALQIKLFREAISQGIKCVYCPGLEADDVLATMVESLRKHESWTSSDKVFVWSLDKDLHQLLTDANTFVVGNKGVLLGQADVETEWGAPASAIPIIKALSGDQSDNIKGVDGIGPKTAAKIIRPVKYRKPTPWWLDYDKVPENKQSLIKHLEPRIVRDEMLCTLISTGELFNDLHTYIEGGVDGKS